MADEGKLHKLHGCIYGGLPMALPYTLDNNLYLKLRPFAEIGCSQRHLLTVARTNALYRLRRWQRADWEDEYSKWSLITHNSRLSAKSARCYPAQPHREADNETYTQTYPQKSFPSSGNG